MQTSLLPLPEGITILRNFIARSVQERFVATARWITAEAPLVAPRMWNGSELKVKVTSCGKYGWFADEKGYKYLTKHPLTNKSFPAMPKEFKSIAVKSAAEVNLIKYCPDTCLINYYRKDTGRLGLHVDNTEEDTTSPIVTISLGDSCIFLVGGLNRSDKPQKVQLDSGDVLIMHRQGRMLYHGVDALIKGSSDLLKSGGRISLTFRRNKS